MPPGARYPALTLDSIGDEVISADVHGRVTYMNMAAEDLTGWSRARAIGRPLAEVFRVLNATTGKPAENPAQRAINEDRTVDLATTCILLSHDGDTVEIEDSAAPIHDRAGALAGAVIVFHDAKFSHAVADRMAYLASRDVLTGLHNRVSLMDHFSQALNLARRHGNQVGLLFIDLDGFKQVNDTLGHESGDRLLAEINRREDAALVARKLKAAVAAPRLIDGHEIALTLSVGIAIYPDDGEDPRTLLRVADSSMYSAKMTAKRSRSGASVGPASFGSAWQRGLRRYFATLLRGL